MPAYAYTPAIVQSLQAALSQCRLDAYLEHARSVDPAASAEDAFDLYVGNLQVSAAFQGPLHILEVSFRNAMSMTLGVGLTSDWIDDPRFIHACIQAQYPKPQPGQRSNQAGPDLLRDIYKVRSRLASTLHKKNAAILRRGGRPSKTVVSVNDVIAGLEFGFWTKLLESRFEHTLWRRILYHAFPRYGAVTGLPLERRSVEKRFNELRELRNRVMHHEPLFNRNLAQDMAAISEAISWMFDDVGAWVTHHSRLPAVQAAQSARPEVF